MAVYTRPTTARVVELLGRLNFCLAIGEPVQRAGAYERALEDASRDEIAALCAVLAEGNGFGAAAARRLAGVVS